MAEVRAADRKVAVFDSVPNGAKIESSVGLEPVATSRESAETRSAGDLVSDVR